MAEKLKEIHDTIQGSDFVHPKEEGELIHNAMLNGWVLIAEWVTPDGSEWLTLRSSDYSGVRPLSWWRKAGFLTAALED